MCFCNEYYYIHNFKIFKYLDLRFNFILFKNVYLFHTHTFYYLHVLLNILLWYSSVRKILSLMLILYFVISTNMAGATTETEMEVEEGGGCFVSVDAIS